MAGKKGKGRKKDKGKRQSDDLKLILASVTALSTKFIKLEEAVNTLRLDHKLHGQRGPQGDQKKQTTRKKSVAVKAVGKKVTTKKTAARKKTPVKKAVARKTTAKRRVTVRKAAPKKARSRRK